MAEQKYRAINNRVSDPVSSTEVVDKKWYQTWWGALWVLGFSDLPGGVGRFQKWDKAFNKTT